MALNFEINTGDAAKKIDDLKSGIASLGTTIDGVKNEGLDRVTQSAKNLGDVAPDIANIAKSLDDAAVSAQKLNAASVGLEQTKEGLKGIEEAAQSAAPAVEKVTEAVTKVGDGASKASAKTGETAASLTNLTESFGNASGILTSFNNMLGGAGEGLAGLGRGISGLAGEFGSLGPIIGGAGEALTAFGAAATALLGVVAAVGVAVGALFLALRSGSSEVGQEVENLQRRINAFSKDVQTAPAALKQLEEAAYKTGFSVKALETAFGKYITTAEQAGLSATKAADNFDKMALAAKAMGATEGNFTNFMTSIDRGMANGTITAGVLGRALQTIGLSLDAVAPKFVGTARNTQIASSAMQGIIDKIGEIGARTPLLLTLDEYANRLSNSFREMQASFNVGQVNAERDALNALTGTVHYFQEELDKVSHFLGGFWGIVKSVFDYLATAVVAAVGEAVRVLSNFASIINNLTFGGLSGLWELIKLLAGGVGLLVQGIGSLVSAFNYLLEILVRVTELFEARMIKGIQVCWEYMKAFASWLSSVWQDVWNALPDWVTGAVDRVIDGMKIFFDWMKQKWDQFMALVDAVVAKWKWLMDFIGMAPKIDDSWNRHLNDTLIMTKEVTKATKEMKDVMETVPKWIQDLRSGKVDGDPNNAKNGGASGQKNAGRLSPSGFADQGEPTASDQYSRPGGQYSGDDLIYGTGAYDTRPGNLKNQNYTSPENQWQYQPPEYQAPGSTPAMPVYLTDPSSKPIDVPGFNSTGPDQSGSKQPFTPSPTGAGTDNTQQFRDSVATTFATGFSEFRATGTDIVDALAVYGEQIGSGAAGEKLWADTVAKGAETFDAGNRDLMGAIGELNTGVGSLSGDVTGLSTDITTSLVPAFGELSLKTYDETKAVEAETSSTDKLISADQALAGDMAGAAGGLTGGGGGGGGGGATAPNQNNFSWNGTPNDAYLDTGGVIGQWGGRLGPAVPMSAWVGAKHFAGGGITDGGQPIIAHPNEAVIPLAGGAVPVALGRDIPQGLADVQETMINVGALAHEDAIKIEGILNNINQSVTNSLVAFQAISSQMAAAASSASSSSSFSSSSSSGGLNPAQGGGGLVHRGAWGTSSVQQPDGTWKNQGYLPNTSTSVFSFGYGGQKTDATGKPIIMNGAAFGLENTNSLDGMSPQGVPITVHPNEAIVPLPDGRAIPVTFPGWGGQQPGVLPPQHGSGGGFGGGGTTVVHIHMPVQDMSTYGHGPTVDQHAQKIRAVLAKSFAVVGTVSSIDDPTVRVSGAGAYGRGTAIAGGPQIL